MAVLGDIARQAGVSISTASRALQNDPRISIQTKQRVLEIADSLGYNKHLEKNIPIPGWDTVGLIVPEVLSGYYAQLVHLVNDKFSQHQMTTIVKITNFRKKAMIRNIENFTRQDVKALLVVLDDYEEISQEILETVCCLNRPTMFITSNYISNLDFDSLYIDEHRGVAMALEHLVERGYERIGFIGEEQTIGRLRVYQEIMRRLGMPANDRIIKVGPKRAEEGGYLYMRDLLKQGDYPDAVLCGYDQMAIGAIFAIEEAKLRIPEDVAVVGFDDILLSKYIHKGLTTIKNPCEDMVDIAVRVLLKRIEQPNTAPQQIALKPSIIIRGTT